MVDLTHSDRPLPGTVFHVTRMVPGGLRRDVGSIELFEVGASFSTARVLPARDKSYPEVLPGDEIYNEFFERRRPRTISIVGEPGGAFSREDLAAKLRSLGDVYQPGVEAVTELVVVCPGFQTDPGFARAKGARLRMISEKYFYEYLGLTYTARR
jgi:hypothetical protein